MELIKDQGMQLERMCAFASALKYYFAGVQYFNKLDRRRRAQESDAAGNHSDDRSWRELREKFKALYENLIPMTNAEVLARMFFDGSRCGTFGNTSVQAYQQAKIAIRYQSSVLQRGTMIK